MARIRTYTDALIEQYLLEAMDGLLRKELNNLATPDVSFVFGLETKKPSVGRRWV